MQIVTLTNAESFVFMSYFWLTKSATIVFKLEITAGCNIQVQANNQKYDGIAIYFIIICDIQIEKHDLHKKILWILTFDFFIELKLNLYLKISR